MRYSGTNKRPVLIAAARRQPSSERSMEFEKRFRTQTLLIAIATPILTALLSWIVIAYQLGSEHSFVSQQKSEARRQSLIDEKMRLTGEAARLSGQMLGIRRQLALDTLRIELYATIGIQSDKMGDKQAAGAFIGDLGKAEDGQREDSIRLYSIAAELQSVLKMSSIHFGPKTQEAIQRFGAFTLPFEPPVNREASVSEVYSHFTTQLKAVTEYEQSVYAVINEMASEVAGEFTNTSK
jgi:hypothetical protein